MHVSGCKKWHTHGAAGRKVAGKSSGMRRNPANAQQQQRAYWRLVDKANWLYEKAREVQQQAQLIGPGDMVKGQYTAKAQARMAKADKRAQSLLAQSRTYEAKADHVRRAIANAAS